jgi:hypothetical protein
MVMSVLQRQATSPTLVNSMLAKEMAKANRSLQTRTSTRETGSKIRGTEKVGTNYNVIKNS